jgi:3-oxoadipate enol-lactonase
MEARLPGNQKKSCRTRPGLCQGGRKTGGGNEVIAIQALPELFFERLMLSNGQRLHVVEAGPRGAQSRSDDPTILMLHGGAGNWRNWSRQIAALAGRYRIVAPDLRGHGVSPWSGPCYLEDFQTDVRLLLDLKVTGPYVMMAHSFGGCLAAGLAAEADERLRGLALLNTSGSINRGLVYRFLQLFSGRTDDYAKRFPYAVACDSQVSQHLLWHVLKEWNCWPLFSQFRVPTLAVSGQLDLLIPARTVKRMAQAIPNARYHQIRSCGHVPMWEAPEELGRLLDDWLGWAQF